MWMEYINILVERMSHDLNRRKMLEELLPCFGETWTQLTIPKLQAMVVHTQV